MPPKRKSDQLQEQGRKQRRDHENSHPQPIGHVDQEVSNGRLDASAIHGSDLCKRCERLDLETMFSRETRARDAGCLASYQDLVCPFCTAIWRMISMHWGDENPLHRGNARPKLFIQSKLWGRSSNRSRRHRSYRILLAIDQQPPDFQLKRRALPTDKQNRFILGELELAPGEASNSVGTLLLRRPIRPSFEPDLLRLWLDVCQNHRTCNIRHPDKTFFQRGFRLIDVFEERLVEVTVPCEYFALSYVWGNRDSSGLQTTTRNVRRLKQHSALAVKKSTRATAEQVPRTIANAMELCRAVGKRYLWVDRLCILQDDLDEKMRLIHGMDQVYKNASVTVFAASGNHADYGLSGCTSRENLPFEEVHSVSTGAKTLNFAIARISMYEQLRVSPWNTRGWTYQEQVLSNRRLFFTPDEVFFHCPCGIRREGYQEEALVREGSPWWGRNVKNDPEYSLRWHIPRKSDGMVRRFSLISAAVSVYTRRELSYPQDVLNAFSGVYHQLVEAGADEPGVVAAQGVPVSYLPMSLLWFVSRSGQNERIIRRPNINPPSWSWVSWMAPIDFFCLWDSSFPAPNFPGEHYPNFTFDGNYSLIRKCHLTFNNGKTVTTTRFPGMQQDKSNWPHKYYLKPNTFLRKIPKRSYVQATEELIRTTETRVGLLEFVAPCLSFESWLEGMTERPRDGQWQLTVRGRSEYCAFIVFDSDEEQIDELIMMFYNGTYAAICVKNKDGVSKRVGLATFTASKLFWMSVFKKEALNLCWRHVRLH